MFMRMLQNALDSHSSQSQRAGMNPCTIAAALVFAIGAGAAHAQMTSASSGQAYPAQQVRIIVPYPPGGGTDLVARDRSAVERAAGSAAVHRQRAARAGSRRPT